MGKTIIDGELDGPEYRIPNGFEDIGRIFPRQPLRPAGQEDLIRKGHPFFTVAPRQGLDLNAMLWAFDPAWHVAKVDFERPDRQYSNNFCGCQSWTGQRFSHSGQIDQLLRRGSMSIT